jgi:hypothetical protein
VAAGDVNGDGFDDLIVGAPSEPVPATSTGRVHVFSGRDGLLLRTISGGVNAGDFGEAVAAIGDLNGDGACEFAVGAPEGLFANQLPGFVVVYDGQSGQVLAQLPGDVYFDAFGQAVSGLGDVNSDGVPDFAVGAPRPQVQGPFPDGAGFVRVFSGATLQALATLDGVNLFDSYGAAVAGAGDVNLDGFADVLIGIPGFDSDGLSDNGRVEVISGEWITRTFSGLTPATPKLLGASNGAFTIGQFGFAVAGVGDTNGDGYPDLLAGGPQSGLGGFLRGVADLLSGEWVAKTSLGQTPLTPRVLDRFNGEGPQDLFGRSVSAIGDIDQDGYADFAVGASESVSPGPGPGYVTVYSGQTSDVLHSYRGNSGGDRVGWALDGAVTAGDLDFNGDGRSDLAMGADIGSGPTNGVGTAHMLSGTELALSSDQHVIARQLGGTQNFVLRAGSANSQRFYLLLGSFGGTTPGTPLLDSGLTLPLVLDSYLLATLQLQNPLLSGAFGQLDNLGQALADLSASPNQLPASLAGLTAHHAYAAFDILPNLQFTLASNPVPLSIRP